jgi:hypothetical protein
VALPAVGVSGFTMGAIRSVFVAFLDNGDIIEEADGVLGGKGGNAAAAEGSLAGTSEGVLVVSFEGIEIFRVSGRFSLLEGV